MSSSKLFLRDALLKFVSFDKNRFIALSLSLLTGILFILFYSETTLFHGLERSSVDFRFFLRAPDEVSQEIMKGKMEARGVNPRVNQRIGIVSVDEESLAELGPWPWPWSFHAELVKTLNLSHHGPSSLVFDIFFIDHKKLFSVDAQDILEQNLPPTQYSKLIEFNKKNEIAFSQALASSDNVFLDYPFFSERITAKIPDIVARQEIMNRISWPVPQDEKSAPWVNNVIPPLVSLADKARGLGYANIKYEKGESTNRRMPIVIKYNKRYYPGIDLVILMHYYGIGLKDVEIKLGDAVYLKNIQKKIVPVLDPTKHPNIAFTNSISLKRSYLGQYKFTGTTVHDQWAKRLQNQGFLTRLDYELYVGDRVEVRNLKIWMISMEDPKSKGQLIVNIPKFAVDKKKEVTLGKDVLISFEPVKNGSEDSIKIVSFLDAELQGVKTYTDIMTKPNKERTIAIPVDDEGFMNINFAGGQESFAYYPYHLFVPKPGADQKKKNEHYATYKDFDSFEDKIIFVAIYKALGLVDVHKSPYGPMFGIEHHANAVNTVLNQDFLYEFGSKQNYLIILVIALVMGLLLPRFSTIAAAAFSILGVIVYIFVAQYVFNKFSIIYAFATPAIQIIISFSIITVYRVLTEEKKSKYIKSTFSKFVSKSVVNELLSDPDNLQLGGEDRIITVYFSDIRGFTSISEALSPQELVNFLNEYLSSMTEIILKYDGTLDKYMGDAIMAFWGAPLPMEDHALRAVKCSLEMMAELHRMQQEWIKEGKPPINIGIGLNTGNATVGNMGSANRMDYTCMGDTVNLGSRLEGINKVYETNIIMSEYTYAQVKDYVIARELDLIQVKGKTQPVYIYELIDMKDEYK